MSFPDNKTPGPVSGPDDPPKVAHELASLLDGCLRNVNLVMSSMRAGAPGPDAAQREADVVRRLETANQALQQMAGLVHQWMAQSARPQLQAAPAGWTLGHVVTQAVNLMEPAAQSAGIDVRVAVDPSVAGAPAGLLYPAIANALRNSIEALASWAGRTNTGRGHVELAARREGTSIEVVISDDGPGLDPAAMDSANRPREGVTTKPQGHGLGLGVARQAVQRLGGSIELKNRSPYGTAMFIRFPAPAGVGAAASGTDWRVAP